MNKKESMIVNEIEKRRKDTLELLQKLIRIPSLAGKEKKCQEIVADHLRKAGMEVDMWEPKLSELQKHPAYVPVKLGYKNRPNVIGRMKGNGKGRSLKLNGHVDVVPLGSRKEWKFNPWGGKLDKGRVYGRGSADMKGGLTAGIIAIETLVALNIELKGDLLIESVVDEELGGNGTLASILKGYKADATIFMEPSTLEYIWIASRGAQFFRIEIFGEQAGHEYKFEVVNPIEKAFQIYQAVENYSILRESKAKHPLYSKELTKVPLTICKIKAGDWPSTISSKCMLEGTIECLPGENIQEVKSEFYEYLIEYSQKDSWFQKHPLKIKWFGLWFDPAEINPREDIVTTIKKVAQKITNKKLLVSGGGGCDLRLPILYQNTPSVVFGPGGGKIHSTNEYVELEEVCNYAKILALLIVKWCC